MKAYLGISGALCGVLLSLLFVLAGSARAEDSALTTSEPLPETQVMHAFTEQAKEGVGVLDVPDRQKHLIMFSMGVALLIFLSITVAFGVAMALYGKRVFVPHMIFAGFSLTLAIVHSVVAVVWFFPSSSP
ncbi:MAG: hypothetical protein IT488_07360 [Gammaproteobacteria bacterium]|nr:hypothetical protein [Gammaproteobacteria bacterium]